MRDHLQTARVAALFKTDESLIRRFDIPQLLVIKISLPRPQIQGTVTDTDMHGKLIGRFEPATFRVIPDELLPPRAKKEKTRTETIRDVLSAKSVINRRFALRLHEAGRPGSDLLSRALRQSTIGAAGFHGRVRNGIGWDTCAITTWSSSCMKHATGNAAEQHADAAVRHPRSCFI